MINNINLTNYKKFKNFDCNFSNELPNVISGDNAVGKTSILSSINLILTGRNLYGKKINLSINNEENFFQIKSNVDDKNIEYYYDSESKDLNYKIKDIKEKSSVIFVDSKLVYEFQNLPSKRMKILRNFIHSNDDNMREEFNKIEEYRKEITEIIDSRHDLATKKKISQRLFKEISIMQYEYYQRENYLYTSFYKNIQKEALFKELDLSFEIDSDLIVDTAKEIFDYYKENIDKILEGREKFVTLSNDSLIIKTNGEPINDYFSKGQLRILLTLIINSVISLEFFSQKNKYLLLDDYFSELSENSIILLINTLKKHKAQIFITNPSKNLNFLSNIAYNINI